MKSHELPGMLKKLKQGMHYQEGGQVGPYSTAQVSNALDPQPTFDYQETSRAIPADSQKDLDIMLEDILRNQPNAVTTPTTSTTSTATRAPIKRYDPQAEIDFEDRRLKEERQYKGFSEEEYNRLQREKLARQAGRDPNQFLNHDWTMMANRRWNPDFMKTRQETIENETTGGYTRRQKQMEADQEKAASNVTRNKTMEAANLKAQMEARSNDANDQLSVAARNMMKSYLTQVGADPSSIPDNATFNDVHTLMEGNKVALELLGKIAEQAAKNTAQIKEANIKETGLNARSAAEIEGREEVERIKLAGSKPEKQRTTDASAPVLESNNFMALYKPGALDLQKLLDTSYDMPKSKVEALAAGWASPVWDTKAGNWLSKASQAYSRVALKYPRSVIDSALGAQKVEESLAGKNLSMEQMLDNLKALQEYDKSQYDMHLGRLSNQGATMQNIPPRDYYAVPKGDKGVPKEDKPTAPKQEAKPTAPKVVPSTPAPKGKMVPMIAPDGSIESVPESDVKEALSMKYKVR